ncbi:Fis family transcriptional regulator [Pseudonocardia sulfidoxydans NBRC 16205]|uniref:Fis family transcriptional regulator n=1 Tax=Pseudonocardia sulfidoxydans NBRC 16205 TaxID=1223511 RepID=A0A511DJV7_9PSEU|nr:helix-turn-helix domain-containing protein [Pseudonocardia sulfidoxydans]GEL25075.1 Fis family transcriptional regulator [Pseudonocardia sulfidoxydans NBRC 16205]
MPTPDRRRQVARARAEFLTSGAVADAAVEDAILTSWRRSRFAGVDIGTPHVPYGDALDLRSRLVRCATPVIKRLHDRLAGIPVSIVLTDERGRLLQREDSERRLTRIFDGVYFAPGFCYAEAHVGTNGVGTALEEGRPVFVSGPEHFNERSIAFACAGAPIRNPLTRRIEGLIDLSCLAEDAHPMMRVLVQEAALDIERLLLDDGSERQRVVLEAFLSVSRRSTGAVLSVCGDVVMANQRASALLTPTDEALLRAMATELPADTPDTPLGMSLAEGSWAQVRCHPVVHGSAQAGTVFELRLQEPHPRPRPAQRSVPVTLPGAAGQSPAWVDASADAREAAARRLPLLVSGEAGVGKTTLVRGVHLSAHSTGRFVLVDCDAAVPWSPADLGLRGPAPLQTVVLRHLDRIDPRHVLQLDALVDDLLAQRPAPWVVATAASLGDVPEHLLRRFDSTVTVAPLRHRIEDLEQIVPALLEQLAPGRGSACSEDAMNTLARKAWTGNVTELRTVLAAALRRRPVGVVRREDLPPTSSTTSRRALSPIESLERDAIVAALVDTDGNRKSAAAKLGMSRSSLYRKLHAFGIDPSDAAQR